MKEIKGMYRTPEVWELPIDLTALANQLDGAAQRLAEEPYSIVAPYGQIDTGVIDALWRRDTGNSPQWDLIEFKNDRIQSEAALAQLLENSDYAKQIEHHISAASHLLGQRPNPILYFLYTRPEHQPFSHSVQCGSWL